MKGIVVRSTGKSYVVMAEDRTLFECKLKGQFKIHGLKATNPIAVGDDVEFDPGTDGNEGTITHIAERRNYIIRKSTNLSKVIHIIASNIDMAYLVVTIASPRTSSGFVDRFLVTAEAYHIPVTLVFNKIDIYDEKENQKLKIFKDIYQNAGYKCIEVSALTGENICALKELMENKINLFSGHSGVGKTAILNTIDSSLKLRTAAISEMHKKGKHTTTFAEMYPLSNGGFIIDTPGIKEFGLIDFKREELTHFFPEMFTLLKGCKFYNCTHTDEPGCVVKIAVEAGTVSMSRYNSYLNIFYGRDLQDKHWEMFD
jgi:ribosome biogenesis GTPase